MIQATSTNPYSRGGILPLHCVGDDGDADEGEVQPGPTLVVFPPSIFAELLRFMFFSVDARPLASLRYLEYILAF
jgi:hypothetical protein